MWPQMAMENFQSSSTEEKENVSLSLALCIGFQDITCTIAAIFESQNYHVSRLLKDLFLGSASGKHTQVLKNRAASAKLACSSYGEGMHSVDCTAQKSCKAEGCSQYFTTDENENFQEILKQLPVTTHIVCLHMDRTKETLFLIFVDCARLHEDAESVQEGLLLHKYPIRNRGKMMEAVELGKKLTTYQALTGDLENNPAQSQNCKKEGINWAEFINMVRKQLRLWRRYTSCKPLVSN